jgi:hypothetical protein
MPINTLYRNWMQRICELRPNQGEKQKRASRQCLWRSVEIGGMVPYSFGNSHLLGIIWWPLGGSLLNHTLPWNQGKIQMLGIAFSRNSTVNIRFIKETSVAYFGISVYQATIIVCSQVRLLPGLLFLSP